LDHNIAYPYYPSSYLNVTVNTYHLLVGAVFWAPRSCYLYCFTTCQLWGSRQYLLF